jgi:uncharacterized protein (DUF697 family)
MMKQWLARIGLTGQTADDPAGAGGLESDGRSGTDLLGGLQGLWQWDELASEIGRESQARVALVGLPGAGKSLLFNRLRGWVVSRPGPPPDGVLRVESFGMFVLADLPPEAAGAPAAPGELSLALGEPALVVYVLDGPAGVREADFRYVALLRAAGAPVVVALNKRDCLADVAEAAAEAQRRLGMPVLPISGGTGEGVEDALLPALLDAAPRLAVPLGREIAGLRRAAARRVFRQAALLAGIVSAQPVPLLDLPFQAMIQAGVVMRVGAAYGRPPSGGLNREVIGAVVGTLALRYLAQTALKFAPVLGWALSGLIGAGATLLIGESAIRYYEAGGRVSLAEGLRRGATMRERGMTWRSTLRRSVLRRGMLRRPAFRRRALPAAQEVEDEGA